MTKQNSVLLLLKNELMYTISKEEHDQIYDDNLERSLVGRLLSFINSRSDTAV